MSGERLVRSVPHARRRALTTLAVFALGSVIGVRMLTIAGSSPTLYVLAAGAMVLALGVLGPRRARSAMLALCVLLLACGWAMLRADPNRPDRLHSIVGEMDARIPRVPIEVRGVVTERSRVSFRVRGLADPPMWPEASNHAELRVRSVLVHESSHRSQWVDASGTLRVVLPNDLVLRAGEQVELLGNYAPPGVRRNPGEPDWAQWSAQQGRVGTMVIDDATHVRRRVYARLWDRVLGVYLSVRSFVRQRALVSIGLDHSAAPDHAVSMRSALLLGQREAGFDDVFTRFQRVGVAHVLAISGFHLALVVLMLAMGVRLFGDHPRVEAIVVILALLGVVLLIPLRPPIVRAAIIVGAMLLATRFGRRYDRITILAWVGVLLLVWHPLDAASMGYQLSMGVTGLLVVLSDRHQRTLLDRQISMMVGTGRGRATRIVQWAWSLLKINIACWAVALPVIMYHAGVVGVLAPVVSVLLVPMVAVLMAMGYAQVIIGMAAPSLALRTMWLIEAPSAWVLDMVSWVEAIPFAWVRVPAVDVWWTIASTLLITLIVVRRISWKKPIVIAACLLVTLWGFAQPTLHRPNEPLRATMIDVGDGSCVVLQSGNEAMVWDCGSLDRRVGGMTSRALRAMGVTRLRDVIVTHDNLDHYNALPELAQNFGFDRVLISPRLDQDGSPAWHRVRDALEQRGITVRVVSAGHRLRLGGATIDLLWPEPDAIEGFDDNDTSIVALIDPASGVDDDPKLLLTGDIEADAMQQLRARYAQLPEMLGDGIIELPHHGSARKAAYAFIDWLDPALIMQSTGPTRLNDDRWDGQRPGRVWYTTAQHGAFWVSVDRDGTVTHGWWNDE
ncbi:MAG: ComEC/Rec2 family competence protein [Phycisphaerales bacterium JB052]